MTKLVVAVAVGAALVAVVVMALWPALRRQLSYPGGRLSAAEADPGRWGLATAEQVWLEAEDGVQVHGWWVPGAAPPGADGPCGAVIYFHGNANTIAPRAWLADRLARLGLDVLLFDYRGYGQSGGRPGEAGFARDARAAWRHVVDERGVLPERVVLFGHSLGSAVATELAFERPAAALVLGAPFPDFPTLFRHHAPWLPTGLLSWRDGRHDAGSRIQGLRMPVLVAIGRDDRVIPPRFSRRVYEAAPEPRRLVETAADHNTLIGDPTLWTALAELVRDRLGCDPDDGGGGGSA